MTTETGYICLSWTGHPDALRVMNEDLADLDLHNERREPGLRIDDQVARTQIEITSWLTRNDLVPSYISEMSLAYLKNPCWIKERHRHQVGETGLRALVDPVDGSYILTDEIMQARS